ncbi:MBL fold metallo-hydrolase [Orenia marismortui]|uniref:MBL fold metallo-hydrolase n=1 Tax=Orenia marismortui TaxID=46469 RepID=UPI00036F6F8D|nr:MBL fold metallo-hydrolase [Orenia marismortui]
MGITAVQPKILSAKEAFNRILEEKDLFILDVRNEGEYSDWRIEGKTVESINIPYFNLLDGVEEVLERLPKDKEILVVCAKEGSSQFVAEQLAEHGVQVYYLKGGMKSWSEYLHPVKIGDLSTGGSVYQFVRVGKGCLSYLIEQDGEGVIIDAVRTIDDFLDFAEKKGITIKHILDTHLHADHISGARKLREKTGASYWLSPKDAGEVTFDYEPLTEESKISIGNDLEVRVVYSPGHTIGSTSFMIDNKYLFTGDILFVKSIGRPDLAGLAEDWVGDLRNTLYKLYKELPEELFILPAHFGKVNEMDSQGRVMASLDKMYQVNEGLTIEDEEVFRKTVTENLPPQPNSYQEIRQTNMGKINPDEDQAREMEIGPNRCAVHN